MEVSTLFTQLRAKGLKLCTCKSYRDRTEVYNGLQLVPWATWPWQCILIVAMAVLTMKSGWEILTPSPISSSTATAARAQTFAGTASNYSAHLWQLTFNLTILQSGTIYCIVGNFQRRQPSRISQFYSCPRKFSTNILGMPWHIYVHVHLCMPHPSMWLV